MTPEPGDSFGDGEIVRSVRIFDCLKKWKGPFPRQQQNVRRPTVLRIDVCFVILQLRWFNYGISHRGRSKYNEMEGDEKIQRRNCHQSHPDAVSLTNDTTTYVSSKYTAIPMASKTRHLVAIGKSR